MKVYLIAAITADGYIAKNENQLIDWTSKEDKEFFREMTRKSGVIILGGNTFRTFKTLLPDRRHIVYSRNKISDKSVETTSEPPTELIKRLSDEGLDEVAVCGGSSIYSMFLEAGVVTDVYLTIEPLLFGSGIRFLNTETEIKLKLHNVRKLNESTLLVHYKV